MELEIPTAVMPVMSSSHVPIVSILVLSAIFQVWSNENEFPSILQLVLLDCLIPQKMKPNWNGTAVWRSIGMENGVQCATKKISQGHRPRLLVNSWDLMVWSAMEPQSS